MFKKSIFKDLELVLNWTTAKISSYFKTRIITLEEEKLTKNQFANKLFWQNLGCSEPPEKVPLQIW